MKAVEGKRLIKLVGDELAAAMRGPCVRLRMRLEAKKDGRKKARLIVQGFREPLSWDVGGTDTDGGYGFDSDVALHARVVR